MTEDAIFKEQWNLLKKEMAMGDAHLQQRLEQFIFRQYGRAVDRKSTRLNSSH